MKKLFQNDIFIGFALALVSFGIYLATLAPSLNTTDGGELAAVMATLGIAHPTGYPLLTLVGWAFAHLPLGHSVIWNLNLLVALFCAAAVFSFHRLFLFLLENESQGKPDPFQARLAAAAGTLILAFSTTFWSQALSFEVYALHLLFVSTLIPFFLRALRGGAGNSGWKANRSWYLFAFTLGLSFTNHMTTILLAPAFLYLYFATRGFGRAAWIQIGKAIVPF